MAITFSGLEPWYDNFPVVEFRTADGVLDLHNNAEFRSLRLDVPATTLAFEFRFAADWREIEQRGRAVWLEFGGVRGLRIDQAPDYDARAATTLEGVTHDHSPDESRFVVDLGDFECSFVADSVQLQ